MRGASHNEHDTPRTGESREACSTAHGGARLLAERIPAPLRPGRRGTRKNPAAHRPARMCTRRQAEMVGTRNRLQILQGQVEAEVRAVEAACRGDACRGAATTLPPTAAKEEGRVSLYRRERWGALPLGELHPKGRCALCDHLGEEGKTLRRTVLMSTHATALVCVDVMACIRRRRQAA